MGEIRITQADQFPLLRSVRDELTCYDTDTLNSQMGDALSGIAGLDAVEVGVMSATKEWDLSTCPYFREMATALNELMSGISIWMTYRKSLMKTPHSMRIWQTQIIGKTELLLQL